MSDLRLVVIADPDSLRYECFRNDLNSWHHSRGSEPDVTVIHWRDVCARDGRIEDLLPDKPAVMRIESPARDRETMRALLWAGQRRLAEPESRWEDDRRGWMTSPRRLFLGLEQCLKGIQVALASHPHIICPSTLSDTALLFDKQKTWDAFREAGLPVPEQLPEILPSDTAFTVLAQIENSPWDSVFAKLTFGSCASGIMVFPTPDDPHYRAVSTVKRIGRRFYNSYDVKWLSNGDIHQILEFLIAEGLVVQQEIRKTIIDRRQIDFRVVVSEGRVIAVVGRSSLHPMTNLHLGGSRADLETCRRAIPRRHWLDGMDACTEAAALFKVPYVGVDLAFDRRTFQPYLIEVNAFGDFFPRWTNSAGQTIHRMQIESLEKIWQERS